MFVKTCIQSHERAVCPTILSIIILKIILILIKFASSFSEFVSRSVGLYALWSLKIFKLTHNNMVYKNVILLYTTLILYFLKHYLYLYILL